jgi:hypothetical protein
MSHVPKAKWYMKQNETYPKIRLKKNLDTSTNTIEKYWEVQNLKFIFIIHWSQESTPTNNISYLQG